MEMNMITIFLIFCIIALVAYIGYIKGKSGSGRNYNLGVNDSEQMLQHSNEKLIPLRADKISRDSNKIVKRDPKNAMYLANIKNRLRVAYSNIAENSPFIIFGTFLEMHSNLCDYYGSIKSNKNTTVSEIDKVVNWGPLSKAKSDIEKLILEITDYLLNFSYSYVNYLQESYPGANMRSVLHNEMQVDLGKQKLLAVIRKTHHLFYTEFNELVSIQSRCLSLWRTAKPILEESDFDVAGFAKNFGLGALIAVNPFIGVPALIASYFGDNEKQKRKEQAIEEFAECYDAYLSQWDALKNLILENIAKTMTKDIEYFLLHEGYYPIIKALEIADNSGYSIEQKVNELLEYIKEK